MIYLSSKMSGLPDFGDAAFKEEARRLKGEGKKPFIPQVRPGIAWVTCIRDDLFSLMQCSTIHMFGPWYRSHGALIELIAAHRMGLKVEIAQPIFKPLEWILNFRRKQYA